MSQNRRNSKIKINAIPTNEKHELKKEIKDKKLLINNDKYLRDYCTFDIKIKDPKPNTKKNSTSVASKGKKDSGKLPKPIKPSNNLTQTIEKSEMSIKSREDPVKMTISKIEKIYIDTLNKLNGMKVDSITSNKMDEELFKQEILFLKQKNEILKLKSDFFEIIFFSIKNLIEPGNSKDQNMEIEEKIFCEELKNKILCILTQNNKYYYDNLNFFHKDKSKDFIFAFDSSINHEEELINKRCLDSIHNIEKSIEKIIKDINFYIQNTSISENNTDEAIHTSLYMLKQNLLSSSKEIMSYYLLSDNLHFEFNLKNKFFIGNSEKIQNHEIIQRKGKIQKDFSSLIEPLVNKVITKKNKNDLSNFVNNISNFYENNQLSLLTENYLLKSFNNESLDKLNKGKEKIIKIINEFIEQNSEAINKLNDIIGYLVNNKEKNNEKVIFSLFNTEKENYINLINNFNLLNKKINLIK